MRLRPTVGKGVDPVPAATAARAHDSDAHATSAPADQQRGGTARVRSLSAPEATGRRACWDGDGRPRRRERR